MALWLHNVAFCVPPILVEPGKLRVGLCGLLAGLWVYIHMYMELSRLENEERVYYESSTLVSGYSAGGGSICFFEKILAVLAR